jgi:NAD(P)-dependent dehydrogenase (short-subunit alcohol dehydrogenase family)
MLALDAFEIGTQVGRPLQPDADALPGNQEVAKELEKPRELRVASGPGDRLVKAEVLVDRGFAPFDRIVDLNLKGTFFFLREAGRAMVEQKAGSIIACSSIRAATVEAGLAVYGATKAAISLLVKGFAAQLGAHGVRVNAIAPSIIETASSAPIKTRPEIYEAFARHTVIGRRGQPSEVGAAVAFLASDAASYISGSTMLIDAGWTAIDGPPTGSTKLSG